MRLVDVICVVEVSRELWLKRSKLRAEMNDIFRWVLMVGEASGRAVGTTGTFLDIDRIVLVVLKHIVTERRRHCPIQRTTYRAQALHSMLLGM